MGFSKSVHILTFVISVIIISTHNCNAERMYKFNMNWNILNY